MTNEKAVSWLRFIPGKPFQGVDHAGVALQLHRHGFHIGVIHRGKVTEPVKCLHLAWHLELMNDEPLDMQAWVQPPYPRRRLRSIAAYCRRLVESKNTHAMKYAFRYSESKIVKVLQEKPAGSEAEKKEPEYAITLGPTEHGFTCATFVLLLFRAAGIELVKVLDWPARDSDREWQQEMLKWLRRGRPVEVSVEDMEKHLEHLESEVGCARFRPEEVAAAASRTEYPVHHDDAWRMGEEVAAVMRAAV